ncbi:MAG: uroporphyrinogen decarboxylase family protein [Christensenellales bacterium]
MSHKQLLLDVLSHREAAGLPWVPFAGVHAGKLIGRDARAVLQDEEALFEALMAVNRLYSPQGQPVMFDLQIEAEILGCELVWPLDCPPSVKTHPLAATGGVPGRDALPEAGEGRIPLVTRVLRRMKAAVGDDTALFALVCGPFTLALHLRGNDFFMDMYDDEDYVKRLLAFCAACAETMAGHYLAAGADVIALVDPLVSQISRAHFDQFLAAPYRELFRDIRGEGAFSSFFVCGDASRNLEAMCQTGPDSIFVDENVDLPAAKRITDRYPIALGGNVPLTTVMLHGTQQDNMRYLLDLVDSLDDTRHFIAAPGCDMPYDVPVENVIALAQAVHQPEAARRLIRDSVAEDSGMEVTLPDYADLHKPLMEVFTLDSATCAACTYMLGAATAAAARWGDRIDLVEYKAIHKESIARCRKMGVRNLPAIYINGRLCFSSLIPAGDALDRAIREALTEVGARDGG